MHTVKELIAQLQALKPSLQDKPIKVIAPNGELFYPDIKLGLKDPYDILNKGEENVESIVLHY